MTAINGQDVQAPSNCQQQLARQLIACLGRDSAIHVCKVNGWAGVLEAIIKEDAQVADPGNS